MFSFKKKEITLSIQQVFATLVLSAISIQVSAEENNNTVQLTDVVVTANPQSPMTTEKTNSYTAKLTNSTTCLPQELKDTTQSVSIITSQRLKDQPDFNRVIDVINNATGLTSQSNDTDRFSISARGMNVSSIGYDGVFTFYDTRFNYGDNLMDTALYDRVEVVRGANGFMTGPGNPSASINLVRKRPTKDFQGSASVGVGSWNLWRGSVDASGSLNKDGSVRGRAIGVYQTRDSYIDRYSEKRQTLYGILEADLTDKTLLTIGADYQGNRPEGNTSGGLPIFYSDGSYTHYPISSNTAPNWAHARTKSLNAYATLQHRFENNWKAEGTYNYSHNKLDFNNTYVWGNPNPQTNEGMKTSSLNHVDGSRMQNTIDAKLSGSYQAFGREHTARFNYNFNRQNYRNDYHNPVPGTIVSSWGDFSHSSFNVPEPQWQEAVFTSSKGTRTQHAVSGITELSLTDRLNLTLGARFTHYKLDDSSFGPYFPPSKNSVNNFSKYLALNYKLSDDYSVYTSYTDIFFPQTYVNAQGEYLKPVIGGNYEVGLKGALNDGKVNFSVALFNTRRDHVGEATTERLAGGQAVYREVNGAKTQGIDAEIAGSLTDNWNLQAGWTTFVARDAQGNRITLETPNQMFKLFTTYRLPNSLNRLTIGGGVNWMGDTSRIVKDPLGKTVDLKQKAYLITNFMARYDFNKKASLSVNMNNVFNKRYYTNYGAYGQYQYGAPRNILATFNYQF